MKREFLKSLGLSDELIEKIITEHGNGINSLRNDKTNLENQINDLKMQISDRDKQLKELEKSVGDNESLKQQINKLQSDNKQSSEAYEQKIKQMTLDNAVTIALTHAKAKNVKAARALLNLENAELDGEVVKGLDKQLEALRKSDSYLFETETKPNINGAKPAEGNGTPPNKSVNEMNYSERVAFLASGGTL